MKFSDFTPRLAGTMPRVDRLDHGPETLQHVKAVLGIHREPPGTPPWERSRTEPRAVRGTAPPSPLGSATPRSRASGSALGRAQHLPVEPDGRPTNSRHMRRVAGVQRSPTVFDARRIYAATTLFGGRSPDFLSELQAAVGEKGSRGRLVDPGEVLAKEGEDGHKMFIVHRGEITVTQCGEHVKMLREGDCWGESGLLGLTPHYNATLTGFTMSHVFEVSSVAFMKALANFPCERRVFQAHTAAARARAMTQRKVMVKQGSNKDLHVLNKEASGALWPWRPLPTREAGTASPVGSPKRAASGPVSARRRPSPSKRQPVSEAASAVMQCSVTRVRSVAPAQGDGVVGDGAQAEARSVDIDSLPPRWWAHTTKRVSTTEDVAFAEQIKRSLKLDARHGFKLTAGIGTGDEAPEAGPAAATATEMPLDLELLPPIPTMSPLQKQGIQKQLDERMLARQRLRQNARKALVIGRMRGSAAGVSAGAFSAAADRTKTVSFPA